MATDVSAPLPELDLQPNSVLTITLSDAGAKVTALNVHGFQEDAPATPALDLAPILFLPGVAEA